MRAQVRRMSPELGDAEVDGVVAYMRQVRDNDPLAAVQDGLLDSKGGQLNMAQMGPNFEMSLYIAQATGASIVTDSPHRWREIKMAVARQGGGRPMRVPSFAQALSSTPVGFVNELEDFFTVVGKGAFEGYPSLMRDVFRYLAKIDHRGPKPNWEAGLASRVTRLHRDSQTRLRNTIKTFSLGRVHGMFPAGGIQDNTVNRLLLMSSSENHLPGVPMAFFIERAGE